MTRNFNALSLNAPWNCVTIRLQKPRRQEDSGCSTDLGYYRRRHCHSSAIQLPSTPRFLPNKILLPDGDDSWQESFVKLPPFLERVKLVSGKGDRQ